MRALVFLAAATAFAQQPQNPSPMVEHTRAHARLTRTDSPGNARKLDVGTLYLPAGLPARPSSCLFFHGEPWIAGSGRGAEPRCCHQRTGRQRLRASTSGCSKIRERFPRLLKEAEAKAHRKFARVILGGWSAGCGALRQILKTPESYARVKLGDLHRRRPHGLCGR